MTQKNLTAKLYVSPSTGEACDAAQYIAELVCQRKAVKDGNNLAYKFWNKTQKNDYQAQIVAARRLINEFGDKAVLAYLNNNPRIYSLGRYTPLAFVKDGIRAEKIKLDAAEPQIIEVVEYQEPVTIAPKKQFNKGGSLLSKIRKADGQKET
jgi:hypothetical protein